MAYIYQITNKINGKIYIGKTLNDIQKRFKEHCRESADSRSQHRPLYKAMNKYGIENFAIELLEVTDIPEERERFWIEHKQSFQKGYNATMGGDGKPYLNHNVLIEAYKQLQNLTEVSKKYGCSTHQLSAILKANNVEVCNAQTAMRNKYGQAINQFDLNGNYIQTFATAKDAARAVCPQTTSLGGVTSHITDVCKGKRKTAYQYKWKYCD